MSVLIVAVLSLAVFAAALAALARPRLMKPLGVTYFALFVVLSSIYLLLPSINGPQLPPRAPGQGTGGLTPPVCRQVMGEMTKAGLFVGKPRPPRATVHAQLWAQLPQQLKDAIGGCLSSDAGGADAEIAQQ